jgi:hypothetical protein
MQRQTTSDRAFGKIDSEGKGWISREEFAKAMTAGIIKKQPSAEYVDSAASAGAAAAAPAAGSSNAAPESEEALYAACKEYSDSSLSKVMQEINSQFADQNKKNEQLAKSVEDLSASVKAIQGATFRMELPQVEGNPPLSGM